jgi:hypothetical protein
MEVGVTQKSGRKEVSRAHFNLGIESCTFRGNPLGIPLYFGLRVA